MDVPHYNDGVASDGEPLYEPPDDTNDQASLSQGYHSYGDTDDLGSVGALVDVMDATGTDGVCVESVLCLLPGLQYHIIIRTTL